jgi:Aspartyl protease
MPKTMTLIRASDRDIIKVPMMMFNPTTEYGEPFDGDLDTGNDHTCIHPSVLQKIGVVTNGGQLPVQGVNGTSFAQIGTVTMGFKADNGDTIIVHNHQVAVLPTINCDILIGRDLLEWADIAIIRGGTVTLTFD